MTKEGRERDNELHDISSTVFSTELEGRGATSKTGDANITFIATRVIKRNKFLVVRCLLYLFTFFMALRSSLFVPSFPRTPFVPNSGGIEYCCNAHKYEIQFNRSLRSRFSFLSFLFIFFHSKYETWGGNVYQKKGKNLREITSNHFRLFVLYYTLCKLFFKKMDASCKNLSPSFFFFFYKVTKSSTRFRSSIHPFRLFFLVLPSSNASLEKAREKKGRKGRKKLQPVLRAI